MPQNVSSSQHRVACHCPPVAGCRQDDGAPIGGRNKLPGHQGRWAEVEKLHMALVTWSYWTVKKALKGGDCAAGGDIGAALTLPALTRPRSTKYVLFGVEY